MRTYLRVDLHLPDLCLPLQHLLQHFDAHVSPFTHRPSGNFTVLANGLRAGRAGMGCLGLGSGGVGEIIFVVGGVVPHMRGRLSVGHCAYLYV